MAQADGPLPPKVEKGLLIAGGVALALFLACGLCGAVILLQWLLGISLIPR
jgi:uncharacterized protein involved in exopolysaccharide biosynthesis